MLQILRTVIATIVLAVLGALFVVIYALAVQPPRELLQREPVHEGPTDEQLQGVDPNAGLHSVPLEPLKPVVVRPLDQQDEATEEISIEAQGAWLVGGAFADRQAANALVQALLSKGAPPQLIGVVRDSREEGAEEWRIEIGPVTTSEADALQRILEQNGLDFEIH
jgi:hypothetical protein